MRNHACPARIAGWLTGVLLCLAVTAGRAQPPDVGPPTGAGPVTLFSGSGKLAEGDRALKLEAGFTAPTADGSAQFWIS